MRKQNNGLTGAWLWRQVKGRRFILAEHDQYLWWSDSYRLVRLSGSIEKAMRDLLADYNLPFEPMVCSTDRTLRRIEGTPPNVGALVDGPAVTYSVAKRVEVGGYPVMIRPDKTPLQLWEAHGRTIALNDQYATSMTEISQGEWHMSDSESRPVRWVVEDRTDGLLMPVRTLFSGQSIAA